MLMSILGKSEYALCIFNCYYRMVFDMNEGMIVTFKLQQLKNVYVPNKRAHCVGIELRPDPKTR